MAPCGLCVCVSFGLSWLSPCCPSPARHARPQAEGPSAVCTDGRPGRAAVLPVGGVCVGDGERVVPESSARGPVLPLRPLARQPAAGQTPP